MDRSECNRLIEKHRKTILSLMGLNLWRVQFDEYANMRTPHGHTQMGECNWLIDYEKATITLNPEEFESEVDLVQTLRHECIHILLAPFSIVHEALDPLLAEDKVRQNMIESVWAHSMERTVLCVERMLDNMGYSPADIVKRAVPPTTPTAQPEGQHNGSQPAA